MQQEILSGLLSRGVPLHIAQGMVANMRAESNLQPGINEIAPLVPGSRGGFGLNQWTGPRRRAFEAFAQSRNAPLDDLNTQLDFTLMELQGPERRAWQALQGTNDPIEAARIYSEQFLRPGIPNMNKRLAYAAEIAGLPAPQGIANDTMRALGRQPMGQTMQMSTQNAQPRGLLGQPQEEDLGLVGGLLSRLGMNVNRDRLDRLAMTFAALDGSPGMQPLIENIQARQSERRQDQQRNRTVEWLASQGQTALAEAVAGGMLPAANAVQLALTPADPMAAINLELAQLELEARRNPQPEMPTPQSGIAKLEADRRAGLISDEQYQAALQAMAPQGTIIESDGQGGFRMVQGAGAASTRPMTEAQSKDTVFATRARGALETFEPVADAMTSATQRAANIDPTGVVRGAIQSPEFQVAQNSGNEFLQAILRKDTGAAITRDEQTLYGETYLPQPGDGPDVLAAKRDARARAVAALEAGMNAQQIEQMTRALQSQIRGGGSVAPAPAGQPQRLRFNPETGDFE